MALIPGFGLFGGLIYSMVLALNALAILSEDRFLARIGYAVNADPGFGGPRDDSSVKARFISLLASIRMIMRVPLIAINLTIIVYELILG